MPRTTHELLGRTILEPGAVGGGVDELRRSILYLLADKKPLWKGYLKRRPALETVLHSPELGIIPWSVQNTALDVDRGQPMQLCLFCPPLVILASGKAEHWHVYYRDTEPRRNGNWAAFDCGGQIRGANGFLRLWQPQSSVKLLFALAHNSDPCMFPADLILAPPAKNYRPPIQASRTPGASPCRASTWGQSGSATATTACSTWCASGPTQRQSRSAWPSYNVAVMKCQIDVAPLMSVLFSSLCESIRPSD